MKFSKIIFLTSTLQYLLSKQVGRFSQNSFGCKQAAGYPKTPFSFYVVKILLTLTLRVHSINNQSTVPPPASKKKKRIQKKISASWNLFKKSSASRVGKNFKIVKQAALLIDTTEQAKHLELSCTSAMQLLIEVSLTV